MTWHTRVNATPSTETTHGDALSRRRNLGAYSQCDGRGGAPEYVGTAPGVNVSARGSDVPVGMPDVSWLSGGTPEPAAAGAGVAPAGAGVAPAAPDDEVGAAPLDDEDAARTAPTLEPGAAELEGAACRAMLAWRALNAPRASCAATATMEAERTARISSFIVVLLFSSSLVAGAGQWCVV